MNSENHDDQVRELYRKEVALLETLESTLATSEVQPQELRQQFEQVSKGYNILLNQVIKLTLVGDSLQEQLRRTQSELSATLEHVSRLNKNLRALNQQKDEILALAAHDFRSPISAVNSLAELLLDPENLSATESREMLQAIHSTSSEVLRMIADLLEIYRSSDGGKIRAPQVLNLQELAERIRLHSVAEAKRKRIHLQIDTDENNASILIEEALFLRIADNLVGNAIKFTPTEGRIHVRLNLDDNWLLLKVQDTGPGLTLEDQELLFKKFGSLSAKPTAGESSAGLGLNIAHRIVGHLGGTLSCESTPGKGAKFIIRLPVRTA